MIRRIINIDEEKCTGCGLCAQACHEGAIAMVNGKAKLIKDDYCDGLGDCLPVCPTGAISFLEREAAAYDETAVKRHMEAKKQAEKLPCGCPGTAQRALKISEAKDAAFAPSRLSQWPVQLKLVSPTAQYFSGAELLVAADCAAYACGAFHERFIKGRKVVIGCPKLDDGDYFEKLNAIITLNDIRSVTVVRMEVPCCGGIAEAARRAVIKSGKEIPFNIITLSLEGEVIN